uniref:Uncharacterized protein n=1 Tax=Globodera rostochiensis TaxID=31243 RepID=A0A914HGG8_GLORO
MSAFVELATHKSVGPPSRGPNCRNPSLPTNVAVESLLAPVGAMEMASQGTRLCAPFGAPPPPRLYEVPLEVTNQPTACKTFVEIERLYTPDELARDPIDMAKMSKQYFTKIKPKVGTFRTGDRPFRHLFSRGTINR